MPNDQSLISLNFVRIWLVEVCEINTQSHGYCIMYMQKSNYAYLCLLEK